jgi:hypothetical protein
MNDLETRRYEMLVRVRDFGAAHTDVFPAASLGGEIFAIIASTVHELDGHATSQVSGIGAAREGSTTKAVAQAALRVDLESISRTARTLALDTLGLDDKFRCPRGAGARALLAAARAFARDAAPLAAEFVRHELPPDFLDDLNADIRNLERAMGERSSGTEAHVKATAAIDKAMEKALTALQRLDTIARNKLREEIPTLAAWDRACHVERAGRSKPDPAEPVTAAPEQPAT